MKTILRRRTAGFVMLALAVVFAINRLVLFLQGFAGGRGIPAMELGAALLVAAGWIHAGLVIPRSTTRPSRAGLVLLGGTSMVLASYLFSPGYALVPVVIVTYGVVGLGWGS
ncbi:MAG TPA: hypothetical protein DCM14_02735 [Clostridiales bacterium UBA8153]|nr:hypothetical protein [Clostridiales bacterium UBA8153]